MFFLLLGVPAALAHYYLWRRLVRDTTLTGSRGRLYGTVALAGAFVMMLAALLLQRDVAVLAWPGFMWLALMFYLTLVMGVLEIPRLLVNRRVKAPALVGADEPDAVPLPSRRVFVARSFAVAGGITAGSIVGYGATKALGPPEITSVPVPIRRLDPSLSGFRIVVVSDIYIGPLAGRGHTERIVRMINEQQPDLVAVVGDLVDGSVDRLGEAAAPLRDLVSKHGSFFVTGNHEYYSGYEPWLAELERLGVNPLRNERLAIERGGASFDLAGVNDVAGRQFEDGPDIAKALAGRNTANPVVLLAHQPIQVEQASQHGVDLQLSGHTHGGQMFPFHLAVPLQQPVTAGLEKIDDTWVYVTRGAGFWGPPVRVGAPPEISMIELTT
ncbi:metallophosphoesterase [Kibdelosporangium philippinense]|uniref:Metallophosphoesterase n=1 Tax=Kibdelosporangium philippinense TaxID=211113 RepID=A0ABS8Z5F9_9PSEU|nr:metallophosphoesterase [Kibdelosporangium philippinense]MCE7002662.1 metallophosphoesterase [Kibdelosporangium philippinense]